MGRKLRFENNTALSYDVREGTMGWL